MLPYDHARTEQIVDRLRSAERGPVRLVVIALTVIPFGFVGLALFAGLSLGAAWPGGLIGIIVGFKAGQFCMELVTATLEWMCQLLIAQGKLVENSSQSGEPRPPA